jgi:hypothetical protein
VLVEGEGDLGLEGQAGALEDDFWGEFGGHFTGLVGLTCSGTGESNRRCVFCEPSRSLLLSLPLSFSW